MSCFIVTLISLHPKIERGSPLISAVLTLYCVLMVASAIVGDESSDTIPQNESFIYVVAMAGLSSMVAVFYSSLYFFSAHRYVPVETGNDNLRMTSDDESGSVIYGTTYVSIVRLLTASGILSNNNNSLTRFICHIIFPNSTLYLLSYV